jgi:subtilisin family serine protease
MAAPLVAGAVAVLRSAGPDLGVDEVRDLLLAHAADLGTTGWDAEYGHGRVDLFAALQTVTEAPVEDTPEEEVPDVPEVAEPTGPPPASPVPYGVQHYQRG